MNMDTVFIGDLMWPAHDRECYDAVGQQVDDLYMVYPYCRNFDTVVQAGGNCGVWPKQLAKKFRMVYTFEPDPLNFRCLCYNVPELNVFKFNAAVGNDRTTVDLDRYTHGVANIGAYQVSGAGDIPVLQIDDLSLNACDLIYLDIEGFEPQALIGAFNTIKTFSPVIVVEDKGLSDRYGHPEGYVAEILHTNFGYEISGRIHRDVILTKRGN